MLWKSGGHHGPDVMGFSLFESTGSGVAGWTVMKNTLGNQAKHLQRGSEKT